MFVFCVAHDLISFILEIFCDKEHYFTKIFVFDLNDLRNLGLGESQINEMVNGFRKDHFVWDQKKQYLIRGNPNSGLKITRFRVIQPV